ncbi:MAG: glutamyl-tRNA reductase [Rhodopirellula sp.]|nr:glutamyl-tRNA reductase [Rhodopirellula sp.]
MKVQVLGCSYHQTSIAIREQLAFNPEQACCALEKFQIDFPGVEAVLLSTCNRTELYTATENESEPSREQLAQFLADFHGLANTPILEHLYYHLDREAVGHLFTVASSLDSMVVGEPQILSQVKQAYATATDRGTAGPLTHAVFQAALHVARRIAAETSIQQRRVSIPSVAVVDFAQQIFERFDDKKTLVIGAGEMAEETLRYLRDEGAGDVTVVNRSAERATELAQAWRGRALAWDRLFDGLAAADLVISTTGAEEPVVTLEQFQRIEATRHQRPLFILDLAVPRDFDPAIGSRPGVYLYSIDDLRQACERNRQHRNRELPAAQRIVEQETARFMADLHHRLTAPVIQQLRAGWDRPKDEELKRLFNKLPELDDRSREEIRRSFERLVNKLLHPPLESLRHESRQGTPSGLLEALARLFQLKD